MFRDAYRAGSSFGSSIGQQERGCIMKLGLYPCYSLPNYYEISSIFNNSCFWRENTSSPLLVIYECRNLSRGCG